MKYRPEVDGLRTIAVVPVILFHAGVEWLHGGFVGVDIFFVISGFLITTILINDLEQDRYSILTFYERRARRILPALFLVILACFPFAWMWLFADDFRDFGQSVVATGVFASNFLFWMEEGYFGTGSDLKPLIHTWSLAIEEQYYILFPPLLALAWKWGRKAAVGLMVAIFVVSLAVAQYWSEANPDAGFYLLPSRAWELMIGGLAAVYCIRRGPQSNGPLALVGLVALAGSLAFFKEGTPHPSLFTLIPVLGTALILMFARQGTVVARLLSLKPMVAIGLVSYSAYLWHQPLFAFARLRSPLNPPLGLMLLLSALTLVLAWLTWRYVERPFRKHGRTPAALFPTQTGALTGAAVGIVAVCAMGLTLHVKNGFPARVPEEAVKYRLVMKEINPLHHDCHLDVKTPSDVVLPLKDVCHTESAAGVRRVAIIGDSHADAIAYPVRAMLEARNWSVTEVTVPSCPLTIGFRTKGRDCNSINRKIAEFLRGQNFDLVVAAGRNQILYHHELFDNTEGGREIGKIAPIVFDDKLKSLADSHPEWSIPDASLRSALEEISSVSKETIFVGPIPEAGWDVPRLMSKQAFFNGIAFQSLSTPRAAYEARASEANALLGSIDLPGYHFINAGDIFCDAERCLNAKDGEIYYYDDDHLSLTGARLVAAEIEKLMPDIESRLATGDPQTGEVR